MTLRVLAGALALSLGATALAPVAAQADDGRRRSGQNYTKSYRAAPYSRSFRGSYYGSRYGYGYGVRPYRSYNSYRAYPSYYNGYYAPYAYRAPVVVAPPYAYGYRAYGYGGYRPLLGVSIAGPHFGVWLGF